MNKKKGRVSMDINVTKAMANARTQMQEGAFQQAGSTINQAKNRVRETIQKKTASNIKDIIGKLQSGQPISDKEISLIRAWVVGDAMAYTKMENNVQEWLDEYERLEKSLAGYENKECSPEELLKFHGILEDAGRVSYDLAYFLENRERVQRFEDAVSGGISEKGREVLARTLLQKLESPDY